MKPRVAGASKTAEHKNNQSLKIVFACRTLHFEQEPSSERVDARLYETTQYQLAQATNGLNRLS